GAARAAARGVPVGDAGGIRTMSGGRTVVAVGVFDGLHRGHVALLERALAIGHAAGTPCVVVSFDPHPDVVLAHSFQPIPPLTPIPEKRERLRALGIDR